MTTLDKDALGAAKKAYIAESRGLLSLGTIREAAIEHAITAYLSSAKAQSAWLPIERADFEYDGETPWLSCRPLYHESYGQVLGMCSGGHWLYNREPDGSWSELACKPSYFLSPISPPTQHDRGE